MSKEIQGLLSDIVSHTHNLGMLALVKMVSDSKVSKVTSMSDDRWVVLFAETNQPYLELEGTVGMTQLNKLKYLVDCAEYQEDPKIEMVREMRNGVNVPVGLHFENQAGDFKNDYRFMTAELVDAKLKDVTFRGAKWQVEVTPSLQAIQRFQFQASVNSEHNTVLIKTEKDDLKFVFGDPSSHSGEFVFASGITGKLTKTYTWPVAALLSILKIADVNNCTVSISDLGALQITMDSGIAVYKYIISAQA
jgi:hypothetical protein